MEQKKVLHDLTTIFSAALERVDPYKMVKEHITITDNILKVTLEDEQQIFDLVGFDNLFVIGAGKASAKMAAGVEELLGERITEGIISVKYGHTHPLKRIKLIEARWTGSTNQLSSREFHINQFGFNTAIRSFFISG